MLQCGVVNYICVLVCMLACMPVFVNDTVWSCELYLCVGVHACLHARVCE